MSIYIIQHKFSITNVENTKYQVSGSLCPRVRLLGHMVASGGIWSSRASLSDDRWRRWSKHRYLVTRESTWRPVFTSTRKPVVPHLQRCCPPVLPSSHRSCNRRDRKRKCVQCVMVFFECSRVATKCGLSSHDFFPGT